MDTFDTGVNQVQEDVNQKKGLSNEVENIQKTTVNGVFNTVNCSGVKFISGRNTPLYQEVLDSITQDDIIYISTYSGYLKYLIDFLEKNKDKIKECTLFLGSPDISAYKLKNKEKIDYNKIKKYFEDLKKIESLGFVKIYFSLNNHIKFISTNQKLYNGSQNIFTKKKDYNEESGIIIDNKDSIEDIINNLKNTLLENELCISFSDNNIDPDIFFLIDEIEELIGDIFSESGFEPFVHKGYKKSPIKVNLDCLELLKKLKEKIEKIDEKFCYLYEKKEKQKVFFEKLEKFYSIFNIQICKKNFDGMLDLFEAIENELFDLSIESFFDEEYYSDEEIDSDIYNRETLQYAELDDFNKDIQRKREEEIERRLEELSSDIEPLFKKMYDFFESLDIINEKVTKLK